MLLYFLDTDIPYGGVSHLTDTSEGHTYPDFMQTFFPPDDTLFTFTWNPKEKKLKDFLTTANLDNYGLVISDRVKELLIGFKIPEYKFYPVKIITHSKEEITNYSFLRMRRIKIESMVDYKQSIIYLAYYGSKQEIMQIVDYKDFVEKSNMIKKPFGIRSIELVLSEEINYDFFKIEKPLGGIDYYMSESLRKALKKFHINGFKAIHANYKSDENNSILSPVVRLNPPAFSDIK